MRIAAALFVWFVVFNLLGSGVALGQSPNPPPSADKVASKAPVDGAPNRPKDEANGENGGSVDARKDAIGGYIYPNITAILARERCKTGWCINAVHTNNKKEVVQGLYTCGFDVLVTLPIGKLFLLPTASKPGWGTAKALVRDAINETTVNVQAQAGLRFFYLGGWMSTGIAFVTVNSESDLNLDFGGGTEAKVVAANLRVPYPTLVFGAVQELVNVSFSYASVHSAARTTTGPYPLVEDEKLAEGMLITIGISPIDAIKTLISSTAF